MCSKKKRSLRNGKLKANRVSETEDRGKKGYIENITEDLRSFFTMVAVIMQPFIAAAE